MLGTENDEGLLPRFVDDLFTTAEKDLSPNEQLKVCYILLALVLSVSFTLHCSKFYLILM